MVTFITDYDNLRFGFMIFIFWNGLGKIWEQFGKDYDTPAQFSARLDSLDS